MTQEGSYHIETIAGHVETEIKRLQAQVDLFWEKEVKHYVEFGLCDGMSLVELGSGPGFVTERLLKRFPQLQITALEIDPFLVTYAQNYLSQQKLQRWNVVQGSIMETGLPAQSFDFALVRLLLEHLPDPIGAVREVARILRPGGKAVFVDNDFEMHIMTYPHISELRELYEAYCQSRYAEGGNPKIGRFLPVILQKAGLSKVDFEVISAHSAIIGDEKFFKSEGLGIPSRLVQDGYLPSKVLGKIAVGWRGVVKNNDHSIVRQLYMAVGEKLL